MADNRLRVALIGAGDIGQTVLRAIMHEGGVELVGLSDLNASVGEAAATYSKCKAYTDHRSLLAQARPQALLLAVPPVAAGELIAVAAQRRIHVCTTPPLARNLHEGIVLCQMMDRAALKLGVGNGRRHAAGYRKAREALTKLGQVYLVNARYLFNWGPITGWHGDRSAGSGVLMEVGYHLFDLIISLLGPPQSVYAATGAHQQDISGGRKKRQPMYDSDDTAVVVFRYTQRTSVAITVSRCFSPVTEDLEIYGAGGSIQAGPDRCVLRDRDGSVMEAFQQEQTPMDFLAGQIAAFATAVRDETSTYECSGWENLLTLSAIQAANLSDRTGASESPAHLLGSEGVAVEDCLRYLPRTSAGRPKRE